MSVIPGPRPLPIIGSLHKLKKPPCLAFSKLAQIHGEVFLIKLGSADHVILNSAESLRQAFLDQGETFSHRGNGITSLNLYREVRGEENVGVTSRPASTGVWKMQHQVLRSTMKYFILDGEHKMFEKAIQSEACKLVTSWLGEEKVSSCVLDPINSLQRVVATATAAYALGERVTGGIENFDQRLEEYINASMEMLALMRSGFIDDFLPWLGFLAKFKRDRMREILSVGKWLFEDIYKTHQACYQDGSKDNMMDCFATFHDEIERNELGCRSISRKTVMGVTTELLEGVPNTIDIFFQVMLYMMYFPDVQDKVRDELKNVIGTSRKPSLDDRESLPYTEAVIYEVCRHSSAINLTVPHTSEEDVVLGGRYNMFIPKGTFVVGNLLAIHKDPVEWPNPGEFNPYRFINEEGHLDEGNVKKCMIFSVGKRSCIAEMLSRREIFLLYSTLVHLCRFENEGAPLKMKEVGGVAVPRDGSMKVRITMTDVALRAR